MRSLYWKIFVSFWLASILIILTTAWVTGHIAQKSSIPARERLFMDSYANAAVVTFESGHSIALEKWLKQIANSHQMAIFLLCSSGEIIGSQASIPKEVQRVSANLVQDQLDEGIFKSGKMIVSHEVLSTSGKAYRLVALSSRSLAHFVVIPWAGLTIRLLVAIFFSGLICYLLSVYLTKPLRSLKLAAQSIGTGKLSTRVGAFRGHAKDEIAELSREFDRMAAQLEQIMSSKERLLQDISHELRSPLTRLGIAIELGHKKTNQLAESEFERMRLECERLNSLISEILDFARYGEEQSEFAVEQIDLAKLLDELIADANFETSSNPSQLRAINLQSCRIEGNPKLLHRALENILRNAIKYSPANQPIEVSMQKNAALKEVIIKISDRGPGVPENQLSRIFSPFYRVDSSRVKTTGGYGLGLAIAAKAILWHRGSIMASNRPGGGLEVSIRLPINRGEEASSPPAQPSDAMPE